MGTDSTFTLARAPQSVDRCTTESREVRGWEIILKGVSHREAEEYAATHLRELQDQEEFYWVAGDEKTTVRDLEMARASVRGWHMRRPIK